MVQSMTAFAQIKKKIGAKNYFLEIHSVNRKGLDINLFIPSELSLFEMFVRKILSEHCVRGQLNLKILPEYTASEKMSVESCRLAHETLSQIAKSLGIKDPITLDLVIEVALKGGAFQNLQEEKIQKELEEALLELIQDWNQMRKVEGETLAKDLLARLLATEGVLDRIALCGDTSREKHKEKILNRVEELGVLKEEDHYRLARELILYAEKIDITEEIVRMRSHIEQTKKLFSERMKSIGKEVQFYLQEMTREMNTISAKIVDISGINDAIQIRGELEKIREQIQNIE